MEVAPIFQSRSKENQMGMKFKTTSSEFFLPVAQIEAALAAIKAEQELVTHFPQVLECRTLGEVFGLMGWFAYANARGDIVELGVSKPTYLRQDSEMLHALAPLARNGSYFKCHLEDGSRWKWLIRDGELYTCYPKAKTVEQSSTTRLGIRSNTIQISGRGKLRTLGRHGEGRSFPYNKFLFEWYCF